MCLFSEKTIVVVVVVVEVVVVVAVVVEVVCLFVCVEILRPSPPNGVMSGAVSLPNHTFTRQA